MKESSKKGKFKFMLETKDCFCFISCEQKQSDPARWEPCQIVDTAGSSLLAIALFWMTDQSATSSLTGTVRQINETNVTIVFKAYTGKLG